MTVVQPQYHMLDRYIEHEIVETCERYGIGITPFSPARTRPADRASTARASRCRRAPVPPGSPTIRSTTCSPRRIWTRWRRCVPWPMASACRCRSWRWHGSCACRSSARSSSAPANRASSNRNLAASGVELPADALARDRPHPRFPPVRAPYRLTIGSEQTRCGPNSFGPHLSGPCGARCRRWCAIWT